MKSVRNANFTQINIDKTLIKGLDGVIIMKAIDAWNKYGWTHKYFGKKPRNGYFIWARKNGIVPITTCAAIDKSLTQEMNNLIIIDENIKAKANSYCFSTSKGFHKGYGKIVLKKNSELVIDSLHSWHPETKLDMKYIYYLEESASLLYRYKCLKPGRDMKMITKAFLDKNARAELVVISKAINLESSEEIILNGDNSNGIVRIRVVGEKNSKVVSKTLIDARAKGKGHLDCQGLMINESDMELIPVLKNKCKNAVLTHEASIGSINELELAYLMSRGLSKNEAIRLIVNGFLNL